MTKTYPILPYWRVYIVVIFLVALGMGAAFAWLGYSVEGADAVSRGLMYAGGALLALLGLGILAGALRIRLVLGPAGLEFVAFGYRVRSTWDNVAGYQDAPGCNGLLLRAPTVELEPWFAGLMTISRRVAFLILLAGRYRPAPDLGRAAKCVPVQAFAQDYEHSPLAREIAKYVQERSGAVVTN